jgi:DNA repair protein RadB
LVHKADYLSTNCSSLDRIMGGGIPKGHVTLVYGEAHTGKSSLALQCAVDCARKQLKTIFIDSDNTFSTNRLAQIANRDLNSVSPLIFISKPRSFNEQSSLIENLDEYASKGVVLIIVDTIQSLYRLELGTIEKTFILNRELNRQIAYLVEVAKTRNIAVLLLSQVHSVVQHNEMQMEPVAKRVLKFWAHSILNLNLTGKPVFREALVEKHFEAQLIGSRCLFMLNKAGVVDLSP